MQARFVKLLLSLSLYCHTASREIYPNESPAQVLFPREIPCSQESRRCGCRTCPENQQLYGHLFQASVDSLLQSSTGLRSKVLYSVTVVESTYQINVECNEET